MKLHGIIIKKRSIVITNLSNEGAILYNLENKLIYSLNETALRLWQLINGRRTIKKIIEILYLEYKIDKEKLCSDVVKLIKEFLKEGLVELKKK